MVSVSLKSPFLEPISRTMQALLAVVQTVKKNKDNCITMLEQIHELLYAIIHLHVTSDTGGELLPNMLNHLGKFTEYVLSGCVRLFLHITGSGTGHSTRSTLL
ncbi:hypothetical protein DFH09DRAFT_1291081 [Mycena vulgaris]|nr:hypothetical protein DFH09DRAFT_1291081 [Mycena vulgaris]